MKTKTSVPAKPVNPFLDKIKVKLPTELEAENTLSRKQAMEFPLHGAVFDCQPTDRKTSKKWRANMLKAIRNSLDMTEYDAQLIAEHEHRRTIAAMPDVKMAPNAKLNITAVRQPTSSVDKPAYPAYLRKAKR